MDGYQAISLLVDANISIGFVIIDPPFGVLHETWDLLWMPEYWRQLFTRLMASYPEAPVMVFMTYQMQNHISEIASVQGYNYTRVISWLKPTTKMSNLDDWLIQ